MTVVINGTTGITSPEMAVDNGAADGGQVVLKSSGFNNWNIDNYSGNCRFYYNATELMRIDSSGNVGIGTSSPNFQTSGRVVVDTNGSSQSMYSLSNGGTARAYYLATSTVTELGSQANPMAFTVNGAERARIDSSGLIGMGCNTTGLNWSARLILSTNSGTTKWEVGPYAAATNFIISAGASGGVYLAGTSATSWSVVSDERHKDIIEPITNAAEKVSSLRAVIGKYKDDSEENRKSFLIAQDVLAVLPEAVDTSNPDRFGLAYSDVIPLLVAAIQEQQSIITQLQADVAALKGNA